MKCVIIWHLHLNNNNRSYVESKICMNEAEANAYSISLWEKWELWKKKRSVGQRVQNSTTVRYRNFSHPQQWNWSFKMEKII